jgi:hypothetical protein
MNMQSDCVHDALKENAVLAFDPIPDTWLLDVIDPWQSRRTKASEIAWPRIATLVIFLFLPMLLFSALPSSLAGGKLYGPGSFTADIGIFGVLAFLAVSVVALPLARRKIPGLIDELIQQGVIGDELKNFSPHQPAIGKFLRCLQWLSRVDGRRGRIWLGLMVMNQVIVYWALLLGDGVPRWISTDADPVSTFYMLSVRGAQPNLAGLWEVLVWSPIILYIVMIVVRLLVVFSCLCQRIATAEKLNIAPCHPDGVGGLAPLGNLAFFLSAFIFALGVDLAGMTINELVVTQVFIGATSCLSANLQLLLVLWGVYFVIGTILFVLPLVSLHKRMADAKRMYLSNANKVYSQSHEEHRSQLLMGQVNLATLQTMATLDQVIRSAANMVVWPFNTVTAIRYATVLVSPLTPIVAARFGQVIEVFRSYLGLD